MFIRYVELTPYVNIHTNLLCLLSSYVWIKDTCGICEHVNLLQCYDIFYIRSVWLKEFPFSNCVCTLTSAGCFTGEELLESLHIWLNFDLHCHRHCFHILWTFRQREWRWMERLSRCMNVRQECILQNPLGPPSFNSFKKRRNKFIMILFLTLLKPVLKLVCSQSCHRR